MKLMSSAFKRLMSNWRGRIFLLVLYVVLSYFTMGYISGLLPSLQGWRYSVLIRLVDVAFWIFIISRFSRKSLSKFRLPKFDVKLLWVALVMAYFAYPNFRGGELPHSGIGNFLSVLILATGIGLDEEVITRGLIFGLCEKKSVWVATAISSITFGLFHLSNLGGAQELPYTLAQCVNAAAIGVLFSGLMIYTGSIWVPIFMHALLDFPLLSVKGLGEGHITISVHELFLLAGNSALMIGIGVFFIWATEKSKKQQLSRASRFVITDDQGLVFIKSRA